MHKTLPKMGKKEESFREISVNINQTDKPNVEITTSHFNFRVKNLLKQGLWLFKKLDFYREMADH